MLVLIDGHNLISKMPDISLDEANDEDKLILKLRQYRARTGRVVTVIFDAGSAFHLASKQTKGGLTVRYAPQGTTADTLIIKRLYHARNPQQILVVTSDRAIQRVAKQVKARVISASAFAQVLTSPPDHASDDDEDDRQLSEAEIQAWLAIFNQKGD